MDAATARSLVTEGLDLLARLPPYDENAALALGTSLRAQGHDAGLVAAVLEQSRLRSAACAKFGADADRMLFTRDGLEQATRRDVADHHAARYAGADIATVVDLGCGLGADALGLRRAAVAVRAVDADAATAVLAAHNLSVAAASQTTPARSAVEVARAEDVVLPTGAEVGVWLDPARRTPGRTDAAGRTRRTFRLDDLSPSWGFVMSVAERVPAVGAKLAPSLPHTAVPAGAEAEWVSSGGDLVECALWWGPLAATRGRSATLLAGEGDARVVARVGEHDAADAPPPGLVLAAEGQWLYEADPAILRAGLVGALARACDGAELADGTGYVASRTRIDVPFARRHLVTHVMPARPKVVKAHLRTLGARGVTIKKRGTRVDPTDFRRRLGLGSGHGGDATLLLVDGRDGPLALTLGREE